MRATVLIALLSFAAAGSVRAAGVYCPTDHRGAGAPIAAVPRAEFYDPLPRQPSVTKELPTVADHRESSTDATVAGNAKAESDASGSSAGSDPRRSRAGATPTQRSWRDVLPGQLK